MFAVLLCFAIALSAFSSYFFISRSISEATSLVGKNTVLVKIISQSGEDEYNARLLRVGDKYVNIKSELICDTGQRLEYGDQLIMNANVYMSMDVSDRSKLLVVDMLDDSEIHLNKAEIKNYFSIDGISAFCHSLQNIFAEHVDGVFGNHGALARALLVNDTSDIGRKAQTDFKRSGTSHILAVSGMHIALLMGVLEIFLRKIEVKKGIRIVIISIFALFFLALTAFEASAVRSVLMLYAVYLCYILYEENDSITALFCSVALIILFSPFAVYDLGMWMSFLATLGILTVYLYFDERMPYPRQKNLFVRYFLHGILWIVKALMLTIVANLFLLPIMWYFFGAVSISALPCNLLLSPIVTVLMPLCAVVTLIGFIPYISIPFVFITNKLFDLMMLIVEYFSESRFGVVSLRYDFVPFLIIPFAIIMIALLVIKLKHKWIVFVPMVALVVSFVACLGVFELTSSPEALCFKENKAEITFIYNGSQCSVIDVGDGDSRKGTYILDYMSKYATEIDEYFIANPDVKDVKALESVCKNTVIRKLYLPKSLNSDDLAVYYEILKCVEKYNISVELYEYDSAVEICNGVLFNHNAEDGVSVYSDKIKLKKKGDSVICEYKENDYEIIYDEGVSKIIPLN